MRLTIHKGTNEIGGSCIELATENTTILLDYGKPLSKNSERVVMNKDIDAILISHPHQDHFGEIEIISDDIPVYCGSLSLDLMNATCIFTGKEIFTNNFKFFDAWESFEIGEFTITPFLVDHSATDAYSFLVEAEGKKVLYSGDFRSNGRKSMLYDRLLREEVLQNIDLLLMEGTMIQRDNGEFLDEESVEKKILETIKGSDDITFMISSSQNIDTLVSAFRACRRSKKIFVIDIYTAWILEKASEFSPGLMNLSVHDVRVYKPTAKTGGNQYGKIKDHGDYFEGFSNKIFDTKNSITFEEMKKKPSKYFIKSSVWYIEEILKEVHATKANIIYSQWLGYMKSEFSEERLVYLYSQIKEKYNWVYAHTSGHADLITLKEFASAFKPKELVPIHTEHKELFKEHFDRVVVLDDNKLHTI